MLLISNGCPKCKILESKLNEKGLIFSKSDNLEEIISNGFKTVPMLKIDGRFLDFGKALQWIQDI